MVESAFDFDRLQPVRRIEEPAVYPYAFWSWRAANQRRGGMVCFRGRCRSGVQGERDVRLIDWWMTEFIREAGHIDGLVVDTWEFGGVWHRRLTFLPPVAMPDNFRVLYSVLPHYRKRAVRIWGAARVRNDLGVALAEMDQYLISLPARR